MSGADECEVHRVGGPDVRAVVECGAGRLGAEGTAETELQPVRVPARVLVPGVLHGPVEGAPLRIAPVSFWGGVDADGRIADVHHPQHGASTADRILVLESSKGSSSGSSVLAELIMTGRAPAAIIVAEPDAIIAAGCLAAAELLAGAEPVEGAGRRGAAEPMEGGSPAGSEAGTAPSPAVPPLLQVSLPDLQRLGGAGRIRVSTAPPALTVVREM